MRRAALFSEESRFTFKHLWGLQTDVDHARSIYEHFQPDFLELQVNDARELDSEIHSLALKMPYLVVRPINPLIAEMADAKLEAIEHLQELCDGLRKLPSRKIKLLLDIEAPSQDWAQLVRSIAQIDLSGLDLLPTIENRSMELEDAEQMIRFCKEFQMQASLKLSAFGGLREMNVLQLSRWLELLGPHSKHIEIHPSLFDWISLRFLLNDFCIKSSLIPGTWDQSGADLSRLQIALDRLSGKV